MTTVTLVGWREGMQKISLNRLLQARAGMSMPDSKRAVDAILDGESVKVTLPPGVDVASFVAEAERLGAKCEGSKG